MTLERAVVTPFKQAGSERMTESEFVVALSLDRDWFSPDQAKRVIDVASTEGLLDRDGDDLVVRIPPDTVTIPEEFEPDDAILQGTSTFERFLAKLESEGVKKQEAVAEINRIQARSQITLEAAAALYGLHSGADVGDVAETALAELRESPG